MTNRVTATVEQHDVPCTPTIISSPASENKSTPLHCCESSKENHAINVSTNNTFSMLSTDDDDEDDDQQLQHTDCTLHRSCPELNRCNLENSEEIKLVINKLETDLASAHKEIESLISEKFTLTELVNTSRARIQQLTLLLKQMSTPSEKNHNKKRNDDGLNSSMESNSGIIKMKQKPTPKHTITHPLHKNINISPLTCSISDQKCDKPDFIEEKRLQEISINPPTKAATCIQNIENEQDKVTKNRVIILADQQGNGIQHTLQELLGEKYVVFSFLKPGATLVDVLSSCRAELRQLTLNDYIIIIGFQNDINIFSTRFVLASWLTKMQNTDVIVCETSYNKHLNESKLNNEVRFICNQFKNVVFLNMGYSRLIPARRYYTLNMCRNILQDIMRLAYHREYKMYQKTLHSKRKFSKDLCTQTDLPAYTDQTTQTEQDTQHTNVISGDNNRVVTQDVEFFRD